MSVSAVRSQSPVQIQSYDDRWRKVTMLFKDGTEEAFDQIKHELKDPNFLEFLLSADFERVLDQLEKNKRADIIHLIFKHPKFNQFRGKYHFSDSVQQLLQAFEGVGNPMSITDRSLNQEFQILCEWQYPEMMEYAIENCVGSLAPITLSKISERFPLSSPLLKKVAQQFIARAPLDKKPYVADTLRRIILLFYKNDPQFVREILSSWEKLTPFPIGGISDAPIMQLIIPDFLNLLPAAVLQAAQSQHGKHLDDMKQTIPHLNSSVLGSLLQTLLATGSQTRLLEHRDLFEDQYRLDLIHTILESAIVDQIPRNSLQQALAGVAKLIQSYNERPDRFSPGIWRYVQNHISKYLEVQKRIIELMDAIPAE